MWSKRKEMVFGCTGTRTLRDGNGVAIITLSCDKEFGDYQVEVFGPNCTENLDGRMSDLLFRYYDGEQSAAGPAQQKYEELCYLHNLALVMGRGWTVLSEMKF